jgi:hypothetical protein
VEGRPNTSETQQVSPVSDLFGKRGSQNRGCEITNSVGVENDTRASLSWDGTTMVFGSTYRQLRAAASMTRIPSRDEGESQASRFQWGRRTASLRSTKPTNGTTKFVSVFKHQKRRHLQVSPLLLSQAGLRIVMIIHQPGFVYWPQ